MPDTAGDPRRRRNPGRQVSGILYLSYTGMLEPLGQSQVLAYLERLAADRPIHLVSFETAENWGEAARRAALSRRIAERRHRLASAALSQEAVLRRHRLRHRAGESPWVCGWCGGTACRLSMPVPTCRPSWRLPSSGLPARGTCSTCAASGRTSGWTAGCGRATGGCTGSPRASSAAFCFRQTPWCR